MTNLVLMRGVRFGFAERAAIWFWQCFERGVANENGPHDLFGTVARRERKSPRFYDD
jgi:hypothetical protein